MIVHSIRLKNIKSFGEGPDGDGVTVAFAPGVNRIAGRNGHGKTTLIESLGYALFLTNPQFEENFNIGTYFLRHGTKTGEIDVTFEFHGEAYRIERGIGSASKRRAKVIQLSDSSTCAENDKEVAEFLCELFGFPSSNRFSELFAKLIGVRQGRLTWPFDSKRTSARNFFEPLLEVEIFRRCFEDLKAPLNLVAGFQQEQKVKLAGVTERIADRSDSEETVAEKRSDVEKITAKLKAETAALEKARKQKEALELKETAVQKAEAAHEKAKSATKSATERVEAAEKQVLESKEATKIVESTKAGHALFLATEKALEKLRKQQAEQTALEKQKSAEENLLTKFAGETKAAGEQAAAFASQKKAKLAELESTGKSLKPLETGLSDSTESFSKAETANLQLVENSQELKPFTKGLADFLIKQKNDLSKISELNGELRGWDPEQFKTVVAAEKESKKGVENLRELTTKATERRKNLSEQLAQIGGGLCPFLKETCKQFDPAKVAGNVDELVAEIGDLEKKLAEAESTYQKAANSLENLAGQEKQLSVKQSNFDERLSDFSKSVEKVLPESVAKAASEIASVVPEIAPFPIPPGIESPLSMIDDAAKIQKRLVQFSQSVDAWRNAASPKVKTALDAFEAEKSKRQKEGQEVIHLKKRHQELDDEAKSLTKKEHEQLEIQKAGGTKLESAKAVITDLERKLKAFATVSDSITAQEVVVGGNRENHEAFLTATPLATQLPDREGALKTHFDNQKKAEAELKKSAAELAKAQSDFDPEKLKTARSEYESIGNAVASARADLKHAEEALKREEARFAEWKKAQEKQGVIEQELKRLDAAAELGQLARRVLRDSAPAVAQHLCNRIADRAQVIFNQINQAPAELKWDSESYSIRIAPGDRRFAMLSGGEQTKLALAMTLAMAKEFSGLRFCIFDEPTYGVDAESRPLLANAVLEAQEAAGLEQLLLVSHDDAFEGKIEHAILLEKSSEGSRVASMQ